MIKVQKELSEKIKQRRKIKLFFFAALKEFRENSRLEPFFIHQRQCVRGAISERAH